MCNIKGLGMLGIREGRNKMLEACLALQALIVRHQGGELASLVQTRSQQSWDLLDHGLTG